MARVVVDVMLKPEILDPQGKAVAQALPRLGFDGIAAVRQGKRFELDVEGEVTEERLAQIRGAAETLLSNPVIEDFTVRVEDLGLEHDVDDDAGHPGTPASSAGRYAAAYRPGETRADGARSTETRHREAHGMPTIGRMTPRLSRRALACLVAVAALGTACAPADDKNDAAGTTTSPSSSSSPSESVNACARDRLETVDASTLTIATDKPVYEPWFVDDKPENGQGFEGAVAAAVAGQLGYTAEEVTWVRVGFNSVFKPTPKNWDFDINEFSITEKRKQAVDFSSPYYDVSQAVVTTKGSKAAGATTIAELKDLTLGAQVGTTSLDAINTVIAPSGKPRVYNSNNDAVKALENGQSDALVTDLPTAFYMAAAQLDKGKIVGQLPPGGGTPEQFGLVLDKGSPLTTCVSQAVDALKADGTLDKLVDQWLSQGGAPVLN